MKLYYVYQLRAENEVLPFYIGKGTGKRIKEHFYKYKLIDNTYKSNKIKSLRNKHIKILSEIIFTSTCEDSIYEMEEYLINMYGRKNINTGILTNLVGGGGGGHPFSPETIEKLKIIGYKQAEKRKDLYETARTNGYNHIIKYKKSGLSQEKYCYLNNVCLGTFRRWMKCPYIKILLATS